MYSTSLDRYSYNIHNDNYIKMAAHADKHFIACLQKLPQQRTDVDLDVIYSYLHGMEALSSLREPALRILCKTVRYEYHEANDILYCQSELSTCWYILLSGSVFIEGSMFLPRSSFGKRTPGCARRASECLILEASEMIVIDYPDVHVMKGGQRPGCNMNLDRLPTYDPQDEVAMRRMNQESCRLTEQMPPEITIGYPSNDPYGRTEEYKRCSRASDTSSAYFGSDMMQPDDQDIGVGGDQDLPPNLVESLVDSDEEEGYDDGSEGALGETTPVRDAVRECLEKDPSDRKDDDIEILLDFMQHFRAFANMTLATRRALCSVMVFAVVEKAGTIVMKDGEELDSWSVILNGHVEIETAEGSRYLQMGDSFGITPTMEKLYHRGTMHTNVDDCQFVCIAQSDYYRILHQGEENTRRHEEDGKIVMLTEHREFDGGNRRGHIVIRGTPDRLMQHLIEDHSVVDPKFVEDFLLTYRTFMPRPVELTKRLIQWFEDPALRAKVTKVVLLWVNNHFNDFETNAEMCEFLEHFEQLLERETMNGQLRLLNLACASKARPRTVTLTRKQREEILHFQVLGGQERGCGIFITKVEKDTKAYEAGLKRGDQILEVNGKSFQCISHHDALDALRKTTHLSIIVKSNLLEFKEMIQNQEKSANRKRQEYVSANNRQRLSAPDLDNSLLVALPPEEKKPGKKERGIMMTLSNSRPRLRKALKNLFPRNLSSTSMGTDTSLNHSDENISHLSRKSSTSSGSSSNTGISNHLSASNPDLSTGFTADDKPVDYPEHVVKVYRVDQSFKYLFIHKETTAREVIMLSLREFGITDPSSNYALYEVTVESEGFIKQKRLGDSMQNLPERLSLNGRDNLHHSNARRALPCVLRYYLKNNMSTEPLVPDELMGDLIKEAQIHITQLNTLEVASQLTLEDFKVFKEIQDTEYIDEIFKLNTRYGSPNLKKFAELVNKEMFWVVTEICSETNLVKRMKIMKHFIKIARHCKDCKNFNSMFAIVSGLTHSSVARLHNSWEKLPNKYKKMYEDLKDLMDPSRNMSKYRNMVNSHVQPPILPFFPVVKKDLTFLDLGNDTKVDGLINFEKLRMVSKEIKHICKMCSAKYDVSTMYLGTPSMYDSSWLSGMATMKRTKNRRASAVPNPRKLYDESQMTRRVKSYLSNMPSIKDEEKLAELSNQVEPPAKKADVSPNMSMSSLSNLSSSTEEKRPVVINGPKFGAGTVENTRKLMALSDKVRPHDPKVPVAQLTSPSLSGRRQPVSPRHVRPAIHLSAESSSVVSLSNIAHRKPPTRTGSLGSTESASPTGSISSYPGQQHYESDWSHSSVGSNSYDNNSMCSSSSPPYSRKSSNPHHPTHHTLTVSNACQGVPPLPQPQVRPPLPPYHVVMQNSQANSHYIHQTYTNVRRPPLPDYQSATQMAQIARQRNQPWHNVNGSGPSLPHVSGLSNFYTDQYDPNSSDDKEEEQVSAV